MKRHIARAREDRNIAARDKFATDYTNLGKPTTPAPKPAAPTPAPKDGKTGKPSAPAPKGKPGAPVLPSGNPKSHGKGKGKGGRRSRSPSTKDTSKTLCHFHFNKGNCKHGDKCQYSHSQYHWDRRKDKGDKGKSGRSATPRRSQTPGGKKDRNCYGWLKGDCQKGDKCTFKHDPSMKGKRAAPSTKTSDAKATPALVRKYDDDIIAKAVPSEKKNKMDVKFNYHVDRHEYVKPDFVECSNRKPRRNLSRAQKQSLTCRTTKEIMDDQQYMLQSKLGMTRARAIGILMDDHGEFSDVDEVHVILGPKNDIKLKINDIEYLKNNSRAEMCYEEVIPHVSGKYGRRDNIMCIMPIELKDRRFIMDSGSGHDLISSTRVDRMDIDTYQSDKVNFHTANGITSTSTMVDLDFDTFNEPAKAHVLEDTPSVLSLGKRCMEQGYTFVWPTGREPYMINSEGDKIKMEVHDLIPYVYLGAKDYRPTSDHEAELVMKVLGLMGNNNNASRTIYLDGESGDEMSESDDGVGTYVDGPTKSPRKTTKKKRSRRKTVPAAAGEEVDDDDGYEPSIREENPEGDDVHVDDIPGADEDGEDDDDRIPAADDIPEVDQSDEDEIGVEHGPPEEEHDEDDIDVDDPDGGVRLSKRGTLKHEARTLEHLLTHRYKNPYCNSCVRAKMKHHKTYRGAFRRKLTKFGDLITFDFMDTRKTTKLGLTRLRRFLSFETGLPASFKATHLQLRTLRML